MNIDEVPHWRRGGDHGRPVLVIGGSGFLGSHVVAELRGRRAEPVVADILAQESGVEHVELDIRDAGAVRSVVSSREWGAVIHLAAKHFIPECESDPEGTLDTNVVGTANLLEAMTATTARLVFASSADVYRPSPHPHAETDPVGGTGVYGLSKLAGERLVRVNGADATILRFFNLYGPGETTAHLIPEILRQLPSGIISLGNLESRRDYVSVEDVARVVADAASSRLPIGTYNVGSGTSTSGERLVEAFLLRTEHAVEVRQDPERLRSSDRPNLQADCSRLRRLLPHWRPIAVEDGLAHLLDRVVDRVP